MSQTPRKRTIAALTAIDGGSRLHQHPRIRAALIRRGWVYVYRDIDRVYAIGLTERGRAFLASHRRTP